MSLYHFLRLETSSGATSLLADIASYLTTIDQVDKFTSISNEENAPKSLKEAVKSIDKNLKWSKTNFPAIERLITGNAGDGDDKPADPSNEPPQSPDQGEPKPPNPSNPPNPNQPDSKPGQSKPTPDQNEPAEAAALESPTPNVSSSVLIMCLVYLGLAILVVLLIFL